MILHNDEIHTFDYVTQSITKVSVDAAATATATATAGLPTAVSAADGVGFMEIMLAVWSYKCSSIIPPNVEDRCFPNPVGARDITDGTCCFVHHTHQVVKKLTMKKAYEITMETHKAGKATVTQAWKSKVSLTAVTDCVSHQASVAMLGPVCAYKGLCCEPRRLDLATARTALFGVTSKCWDGLFLAVH